MPIDPSRGICSVSLHINPSRVPILVPPLSIPPSAPPSPSFCVRPSPLSHPPITDNFPISLQTPPTSAETHPLPRSYLSIIYTEHPLAVSFPPSSRFLGCREPWASPGISSKSGSKLWTRQSGKQVGGEAEGTQLASVCGQPGRGIPRFGEGGRPF